MYLKVLNKVYDLVAWILSNKKDKKLQDVLIENLKNDVWSIINHNDALSDDELNNISDKTDNDKNTIYISEILQNSNIEVQRVIYLTNTDWLLDENKNTVLGWIIKSEEDEKYYKNFVKTWTSSSWTGWMESKVDCGFNVLKKWAKEVIIANAKNWLSCLKNNLECSKFYL